jgi:hypothetical protein
MSSPYGSRKVEVGDDMISFFETSTQETDLGIAGTSKVEEDGFVFRRLVDIFRQSLPSDRDRDGLKTFFSGSAASVSTVSILSSGNDNRGLGFGRVGFKVVGRGIFGELFNDSFDRDGANALESGCPTSLFERCIPGGTSGGDKCPGSVGVRWTIVAGAIAAVFAIPTSPMEPILYSEVLFIDMAAMELARDRK